MDIDGPVMLKLRDEFDRVYPQQSLMILTSTDQPGFAGVSDWRKPVSGVIASVRGEFDSELRVSWTNAFFSAITYLLVAVIMLSACSTGGGNGSNEFDALNDRVTALERRIAEPAVGDELAALNDRVTALERRIAEPAVGDELAALKDRVTTLEENFTQGSVNDELAALKHRVTTLEEIVSRGG